MTQVVGHVIVGDLLEDTIVKSAKSQSDADGELLWLRTRLDTKRRDPCCSRGRLALEHGDNKALQQAVGETPNGAVPVGGKENSLLASTVPRTIKVC